MWCWARFQRDGPYSVRWGNPQNKAAHYDLADRLANERWTTTPARLGRHTVCAPADVHVYSIESTSTVRRRRILAVSVSLGAAAVQTITEAKSGA